MGGPGLTSSDQVAAMSKRRPPTTTRARPGQFDLIPNPLAGRGGSSVSVDFPDPSRLPPLNRPRQSGWAAMNTTPMKTKSAPSIMSVMFASGRRELLSYRECYRFNLFLDFWSSNTSGFLADWFGTRPSTPRY